MVKRGLDKDGLPFLGNQRYEGMLINSFSVVCKGYRLPLTSLYTYNPSLAKHDMACVDPEEANWSESALFVNEYVNF